MKLNAKAETDLWNLLRNAARHSEGIDFMVSETPVGEVLESNVSYGGETMTVYMLIVARRDAGEDHAPGHPDDEFEGEEGNA